MGRHNLTEDQIEEIKQSFNAIDCNNDGRLSVHELMKAQQALGLNPTEQETKKMIDEVDYNKSGYIELSEYVELMADRYGALDYEEEMMRYCQCSFTSIKPRRHGKDFTTLSFYTVQQFIEIKEHWQYSMPFYEMWISDEKAAFKHFDKDKSGYLSRDELYTYLTRYGDKLTDEEFDSVISDIDMDGDGRIDIQEFTIILTKKRANEKLS